MRIIEQINDGFIACFSFFIVWGYKYHPIRAGFKDSEICKFNSSGYGFINYIEVSFANSVVETFFENRNSVFLFSSGKTLFMGNQCMTSPWFEAIPSYLALSFRVIMFGNLQSSCLISSNYQKFQKLTVVGIDDSLWALSL
ncbi:MAG: hypothetical protein SPF23_07845 [Paludibacteraceae bacterium]|nr:hypothetical protein [Paludibacteraceae bacterium]